MHQPAHGQGDGRTLYLYHSVVNAHGGVGRWVLNDQVNSKATALAYIDSWAVGPHMIQNVADADINWWHSYMAYEEEGTTTGRWEADPAFSLYCEGEDTSTYFDAPSSPLLMGYYAQHGVPAKLPPGTSYRGPLYVKISPTEVSTHTYLFKGNGKWIVGPEFGVEYGVAFVTDGAATPYDMRHDEWMFARDTKEIDAGEEPWHSEFARMYSSRTEVGWGDTNVFAYGDISLFVRALRSIKSLPDAQTFRQLHNSVPMPLLGLGTGGLGTEPPAEHAIANALHLGYRMLDLAREYDNEPLVRRVLADKPGPEPAAEFAALALPKSQAAFPAFPLRGEVFLLSKVWPTELGFGPTTAALDATLRELGSSYVDAYLLHWPVCDADVPWMHCDTTTDPSGTWMQSWKALERAYAEGKVQSIGVSNFNVEQLDELLSFAAVKPHIVQNFGDLGEDETKHISLDLGVRQWCAQHNAVYMPYATNRNLKAKGHVTSPPRASVARAKGVHGALDVAAYTHKVSRHAVVLKFFMQTGAAIIPRSGTLAHLHENLAVTDFELTPVEMEKLGWMTDEEYEEL